MTVLLKKESNSIISNVAFSLTTRSIPKFFIQQNSYNKGKNVYQACNTYNDHCKTFVLFMEEALVQNWQ